MKVLIVEDDRELRALWSEVFEAAGHAVTTASRADAAREALLRTRFDTVVLDLCLGRDSGLSVAMLAAYANPDCRIVVTTGSNLFAHGELFSLAPTIQSVLRKPVPIQELLAVAEHASVHA